MPPTQTPAIGRIVHYVSEGSPVLADGTQKYPSTCRAADITQIGAWLDESSTDNGDGTRTVTQRWDSDACALHVKNPTGQFFNLACEHDEDGHAGGTWHWPELAPTTTPQEDR